VWSFLLGVFETVHIAVFKEKPATAVLRVSGAIVEKKMYSYNKSRRDAPFLKFILIIIIIIIIFIDCSWLVTRWKWLFYRYTKYEIGYY